MASAPAPAPAPATAPASGATAGKVCYYEAQLDTIIAAAKGAKPCDGDCKDKAAQATPNPRKGGRRASRRPASRRRKSMRRYAVSRKLRNMHSLH